MADRAFTAWTGRDDGPGPEHARWHTAVRGWAPGDVLPDGAAVLVGFASDEGVRRNGGRVGAAEGPSALRRALASLSDPGSPVFDAGDVVVDDGNLEAGQARLGTLVAAVLDHGGLPVVLGGGHAVAYGSYLGWSRKCVGECHARQPASWGVLNIDAHFDLRSAPEATSGTPFAQMAASEEAAGRGFRYAVAGISRANNTRVLFEAAERIGVRVLLDEDCSPERARAFAAEVVAASERVHLSIDLDALPAAVAPGVSAPAGFGISLDAVRAVVREVIDSGRLGLLEVAELNPRFDVDHRTARTAARLVDSAVRQI
ncbi:MAG TPA: formimidoylglutamase [Propionibacterium sp.]|nr:formimidoylglutamase [Propionibacterium sp.]